jgi:hypothetical protein
VLKSVKYCAKSFSLLPYKKRERLGRPPFTMT